MKKLIRIEFELKNPQEVIIYGYDEELNKKEMGCIFTPAGSSDNIINAIQVCGFREAYDFWGCARYKFPRTNDEREKICDSLEGKENNLIYAKDIQLLFDIETIPRRMEDEVDLRECCRCYNIPCTCDNKSPFGKGKSKNPYNLKKEDDVPILKKTEGDYTYVNDVLIKKPKNEKN